MNKRLTVALVLVGIAFGLWAAAPIREADVVRAALDAIDLCYHWAEEAGSGDAERAMTIEDGFSRDCPAAHERATEAYAAYPKSQALALGLLKLNDIGYFELSDEEKDSLCSQHAILAGKEYLSSRVKNEDFLAFCPRQASKAYER